MMKPVKVIDFDSDGRFPGIEAGAVETADISTIVNFTTKRAPGYDCVRISMKNGQVLVCIGRISDFLEAAE